MNEIVEHLRQEVSQLEHFNSFQHVSKYRSVGHFVLENGRYWSPEKKPKELSWGEPKNCFGNCTLLSMAEPEKYIYCEGYAVGEFFPMLHAWCVTPHGTVIDITWKNAGCEYFGMAIRDDYLTESIRNQNHYGLVDNWRKHWPMIHASPKLWRHAINDLAQNV